MSLSTIELKSDLYTWEYFQNDDVCRLCWSRDAHRMLSVDTTKNLLAEKIEECLGINLSNVGAPKKVCIKCCDIVKNFYDFKQFCCEADRKLKEILNNHVLKTPNNVSEYVFNVDLEIKNDYLNKEKSHSNTQYNLKEYLYMTQPKEEQNTQNTKQQANCSSKRKCAHSNRESSDSNVADSLQKFLNVVPSKERQIQMPRKKTKCSPKGKHNYSETQSSDTKADYSLQDNLHLMLSKLDQTQIIREEANHSPNRKSDNLNTENSDTKIQESLPESLNVGPLRGDHIQKKRKETKNSTLGRKYSVTSENNIENSLQECLNLDPLTKAQIQKIRKDSNYSSTFCYICREELKTMEKITEHNSKLHGIETNGQFKCFGCDKRFKNRKNRLGHEINFCKGLKEGYKCSVCGRFLPKRRVYEIHMKAHRSNKPVNLPEEIFKCGKCYELFKTRKTLTEHKKVHEIKEEFICEACGRCFTRRDYLSKHRLTHQNVRQHTCPHCDYKAVQRASLLVHLRKHTGERPFSCDLCPQRCVSSGNLRAHRTRHLGLKQFQCTICSKKFGYKDTLQEHLRITHERDFQSHACQHCGAIYSRRRGLRRHVDAKHGKPKVKPPSKTDDACGKELALVTIDERGSDFCGVNKLIL